MIVHVEVHGRCKKKTGHLADKYVAISRLSAKPFAILLSVAAVAGAMSIRSAQLPNSTWLVQEPSAELKVGEAGCLIG